MKKRMMTIVALLAMTTMTAGGFSTIVYAEDAATEEAVTEENETEENATEDGADEENASEETPVEMPELVAEEVEGGIVTTLTIGSNDVLVYHPTPNASETSVVKTTCTAPVFMYFGEGKFDAQAAAAKAQETGLDKLAADNGSSVVFVNPSEDSWSDADAETYGAVAQAISDSSTDTSENGIIQSINFMTKEPTQSIVGTQSRIYIYAEGSGADYIGKTAIKKVEAPTFWGGTANVTPAGITIVGLSNTDGVEENDIPVISVGGADEINKVLEEKCGSFQAVDTADFASEFTEVIGKNRRQAGVLLPIHDYAEEGIVEKIETFTVKTTADNGSEYAGTEEHPVNVLTYYAEDLDVENGNVPLVFCFHGGGNTALFEAQATEWPEIGKENGFITVSVDLHYPNCTAGEIVELLDQLKEEYSIDSSRIYASGFSMGGCKSWDLFEQYPEIFAGLAPMDATAEPGIDSYDNAVENVNTDVVTPVFYVGGETSPLPELPCQDAKVVNRVANLFGVNAVTTKYDCNFDDAANWTNPVWGIDGDMVYQVTDKKAFLDSTLTVNMFQSEDGKYYTALASASNQSHEVYARNSWAAWDFLSQFSRNEDGTIKISEVNYALSSDDGEVANNQYNMAE